jgi:hypothetical protein
MAEGDVSQFTHYGNYHFFLPEKALRTQRFHDADNLRSEPQRYQFWYGQKRGGHTKCEAKIYAHHLASPLVHQIVGGMSIPNTCTIANLVRKIMYRHCSS